MLGRVGFASYAEEAGALEDGFGRRRLENLERKAPGHGAVVCLRESGSIADRNHGRTTRAAF